MRKEDIVIEWISVHSNFNKIPCLSVTKEIFDFMTATCELYRLSYGEVFCMGNTMVRLSVKN